MSRKNPHRVLIAGAGPAGLAAALFLAERGADVEVLDERWQAPDDDTHVILHPDIIERLDTAGIHLTTARGASLIARVVLHDGDREVARAPLAEASMNAGCAIILPLRIIRDAMEAALATRRVHVERHRHLARIDTTGDQISAEVEVLERGSTGYAISEIDSSVLAIRQVRPGYLIDAEGAESVVRQQLGIRWRTVAPPAMIAAFEVESRWDPRSAVHIFPSTDAIAVIWPIAPGRIRIAFQLAPDASTDLETLAREHLPWMEPIATPTWSWNERIEPAVAERAGEGAAWLLGDAAHRLPPMASASLNHGIRMAHDLSVVIDEAERGYRSLDIFERHAVRRHALTLRMARAGELYLPGLDTNPFIAQNAARIMPLVPAYGRDLDGVADCLGLRPRTL
jgi:2-polyprenyl-6-methoxyphenol hydroxylase-like FAD-dependent oxidoreductase